jgi:hypothetical protein
MVSKAISRGAYAQGENSSSIAREKIQRLPAPRDLEIQIERQKSLRSMARLFGGRGDLGRTGVTRVALTVSRSVTRPSLGDSAPGREPAEVAFLDVSDEPAPRRADSLSEFGATRMLRGDPVLRHEKVEPGQFWSESS